MTLGFKASVLHSVNQPLRTETVEAAGLAARGVAVGDHVILSWNPHCGNCFYCDHSLPILCETYLENTPAALAFDGRLDLDAMISQHIGLDRINEGFAGLKAGTTIRSVITS